jgi:PAS domain S-box-containing protein
VAAVAILATLVGFALLGARGLALFGTIWLPYVLTVAVGIAAFARLLFDVTEQQRLRAVEQRFRRILDEASDGIRIVDADTGRVLEVNGAECLLTGLGREDLIGRPERDLWPADPALRAGHEALEARARQEERAHAHGLRHRAGDGQPVLVDATRRHVEYRGRRYAIVVSRDAAPRLAAEAAERERAELRSATLLARAAAHEINNPLAVIAGYLQLLQGRFEAESREGRWVGQMLQAAARIGDSVGRLNRLTRIESTPPSPGVPAMLDTRRSATPAPVVPAGEDTPAVPVPPPAP